MEIHLWLEEWSSWLWPPILLHLWEATLFVGLVALGVRLLRPAPARTRYCFWLLAAAKLLFPSVILGGLVSAFTLGAPVLSPPSLQESSYGAQASKWDRPVYEILEPLLLSQPLGTQPQLEGAQNELYCILTLVWLTGFVFFTIRWSGRNLRLIRAVRAGRRIGSGRETAILKRVRSWLPLNREVEVVVSAQCTEAGLWGIWKPVVLLPEGATNRLNDQELAAVLIHELVHVERRDNLVVFFQRVLTCLLWFFPLTWLIDRKLFEERERACDEEVLRLRQAPETYFSGILKVVRACVEQRLVGTSSIGGSSLKRRMEHVLSNRMPSKLNLRERALTMGFAVVLAAFLVGSGLMNHEIYASRKKQADRYSMSIGTRQQGAPDHVSAVVRLSSSECGPVVEESMRNHRLGFPPPGVSFRQIERSQDLPIPFRNPEAHPLLISDARMKMMRIEEAGVYLLKPSVALSNQTGNEIAAVRLEFYHAPLRRKVYAELYQLGLKPYGSFSTDRLPGEHPERFLHLGLTPLPPRNWLFKDPGRRAFHPYVIYLPLEYRPEDFTVGVLGVRFANGDTWGIVPARFPSPARPVRFPRKAPGPDSPAAVDPAGSMERVWVSEEEQRRKIVYKVKPTCPPGVFQLGLEESMVLQATIGKEGSVRDLKIMAGEAVLTTLAASTVVDAVKQWKYQPTLRQGKPVEVATTITIKFVL